MLSSLLGSILVLMSPFILPVHAECEVGKACVTIYQDTGCGVAQADFVATCEGNCYQYTAGFSALSFVEDGGVGAGTNCHIYDDDHCGNEILTTGDRQDEQCLGFRESYSLICYNGC